MNLEYPQRMWLSKLVHHKNWCYWLTIGEKAAVEVILNRGFYNDEEQALLNEVRKYYVKNAEWKGTLDKQHHIQ